MYTLGSTTLDRPSKFGHKKYKVGSQIQSMNGTVYEDVRSVKNIYTLYYDYITEAKLNVLLAEYTSATSGSLAFTVGDGDKTVSTIQVLVDIEGDTIEIVEGYLNNITLVLTEV